jgi:transcription antitermination protein NusB
MATTTVDGEPANEAHRERRRARQAALQMLYQCEAGGVTPEEAIATHDQIEQAIRTGSEDADAFASRLVVGTIGHVAEIDPLIAASAEHWRPERMALIDRLILRMAVYQLLHEPDIPPVVVIDEAVELARRFSGAESSRFVNGVIDAIRKKIEDGR